MDPISASSGVLTLAGFALQSATALYKTVESFRSSKRNVRELKEELEALTGVLQTLQEVASTPGANFAGLQLPLRRCATACKDLDAILVKCSQHSESRPSFRDWTRLQIMGGDITDFKNMITGYKSIIIIALGDANLRTAIVTASVLQEYRQMIENTTTDLQDHLEEINQKLSALPSQGKTLSTEDAAQRREMQEERASTQKCLDICARVSVHISEARSSVFEDISTPPGEVQGPITTLDGLILAHMTTGDALDRCKGTLNATESTLKKHLQDIDNRLKEFSSAALLNQPGAQDAERESIEDELRSTEQGLAICAEASLKAADDRVNVFEDVSVADDGQQIIVSTVRDLIMAKRVTAGNRSIQLMGQMSDDSLQQLALTLGRATLEKDADPTNADAQAGDPQPFKGQYGAGFKLSARPRTERQASAGASASPERS